MPTRLLVTAVAIVALVTPATLPSAHAAPRETRSELRLREAREFALHQLARTARRLEPGRYPTVTGSRSRWHTSGTDGWLAGFWPGRLWAAYEATGKPVWRRRALAAQAPLAVRARDTTTHDLGFLLQTSFGRAVTLTGDRASARVLRRAAASLASRWVPAAQAIRSWDWGPPDQATVIVDNLVNLELLFVAARLADRPEWHDLAVRHALTTAREHVRPDGGTTHVVRFDETTGTPVWKGTVQGLRGDSTWARGHSWAVLGFGVAYRESRDRRLLEAARRTADYALGHLPRDGVPFWDYDAAGGDRARDTTAGAALAAGLLELARTDPDPDRRDRYRHAGLRTLSSLAGPRYLARGTGSQAVLRHGHHSPTYPDAGVTYGDYYFLDALLRAQLLPARRPALDAAVRRSAGGGATAALGPPRAVSAVTVRWQDGAASATRFRVLTSRDRRVWTVARTGLSSGRVAGAETYDLPDRVATAVRVQVLGPGRVAAVRVRGRLSPGR